MILLITQQESVTITWKKIWRQCLKNPIILSSISQKRRCTRIRIYSNTAKRICSEEIWKGKDKKWIGLKTPVWITVKMKFKGTLWNNAGKKVRSRLKSKKEPTASLNSKSRIWLPIWSFVPKWSKSQSRSKMIKKLKGGTTQCFLLPFMASSSR